ncbi:MAG: GNAT family N-acetyltransferase [Bacteroidales bacterium]|nr:GNAT family N-acetyltransferase [Bacteroidales bacterium]
MMKGKLVGLRALEPEDVQLLYQWENATEVWTISNTLKPFSKYTLKQFVEASVADIYESKQWRLMIDELENGETVGIVDIFEFDPLHSRAGIGILIKKESRQKGFAEDALFIVKSYLFERLNLHQIYCNVMVDNEASLALFQKVGFEIVGLKKDWIYTKEGWKDEYILQCLKNKKTNQ